MKLSILIPNYNYSEFVGQAIESALGVAWDDVEVVVVDDGSTDGSRAVIESFGNRIISVFQDNAGQRVACNAAFALSSGDAVIFLDSDDLLHPSIAQEVAAVWTPAVSKVQVQMARIDRLGQPLGSVFPPFDPAPTPEKIRRWAVSTTAYPTPPGSGNIYARSFLEKIFPLDDSCGAFSDSACLSAAPLLGDVVSIAKPLTSYRIHGQNDSNMLTDGRLFGREVARAQAKFRFAQRIGKTVGIEIADDAIFKSLHLIQHRVPSMKLHPNDHPLLGDSRRRLLTDTVKAGLTFPAMSLTNRMILTAWAILTMLAPRPLAVKLIHLRFDKSR